MISMRLLVPVVIVLGLGSPAGQASIDVRVARQIETEAAEFIAVRRDIHRHPEVSGREVRTAGIVAARLTALGLSVRTGVGGHGVVGLLTGGRPGPIVAFRADMDAFPSRDKDPVDFASETPGVRHICGHDVHVAVGLALASALASVRADLPGSVLFIFQPAEENATGARAMLKEGALGTPTPAAIYALHASPYEAGQIATRPGVLMPARDAVRVSATGSGDVGRAMAEARALLATLSTITPAEALQPAADGFAFVQLGAPAPAAGALVMQGTITVAGAAARDRVKQALSRGLGAIAVPDVSLTHQYVDRYIAGATNDADLTAAAMARLTAVFGTAAAPVVKGILPAFSEDFGSFQDAVPGVFFFLGVGNTPKGIVGMPHAPAFVVDETAIAFGARAMAVVLLDRLSRPMVPSKGLRRGMGDVPPWGHRDDRADR